MPSFVVWRLEMCGQTRWALQRIHRLVIFDLCRSSQSRCLGFEEKVQASRWIQNGAWSGGYLSWSCRHPFPQHPSLLANAKLRVIVCSGKERARAEMTACSYWGPRVCKSEFEQSCKTKSLLAVRRSTPALYLVMMSLSGHPRINFLQKTDWQATARYWDTDISENPGPRYWILLSEPYPPSNNYRFRSCCGCQCNRASIIDDQYWVFGFVCKDSGSSILAVPIQNRIELRGCTD